MNWHESARDAVLRMTVSYCTIHFRSGHMRMLTVQTHVIRVALINSSLVSPSFLLTIPTKNIDFFKMLSILRKARLKDKEMRILML